MRKIKCYFLGLMAMFIFSTAFAEDSINIAAIYALTGAAVTGKATNSNATSLQGVRYAVEEVNKQGGILGKQIKLLVLDNLSTPIGSAIAAERAVKAGVTAIVGSTWSSHSIAIAKVAQPQGIPMISNMSTNPEVTKIGNYIFRTSFTDNFQGKIMAQLARKNLNAGTAVIFTDLTSDFSLMLAAIFRENFEKSGGKIVTEVKYKYKQVIFEREILQAQKANADVWFLSGHNESGYIVKQAQDTGITSVFLGGDGWDAPNFLSKGGSELKRGYYCTHWSEFIDSELSRSFVKKYKHLNNFGVGTALGYDAFMVLADAIRRAGSTDRNKIRDALANTRAFKGVTGTITFDAIGDPVKSAVIMEIKNGKPHYLSSLEP
ncbi:ABC transporter substrate-binding protein [Desulfococcaceae bacterium HSG9]|nr:ABC transporter substrate-binding protein [Desulfococcaceae bacterium HSG9]